MYQIEHRRWSISLLLASTKSTILSEECTFVHAEVSNLKEDDVDVNIWYISNTENLKILTAVVSDPNLFWLCNSCVKDIKEGFKKICDLQKSQNEIICNQDKLTDEQSSFRRELASIDAKLSEMANKIDEFDKSVTNVNTQINDVEGGLKKNWTEVVKGTIKEEVKSTTVALNNVVKSIKNHVETINRECNVVLLRLSEAETNSADARNDDKKIVINLLSVITNDEIKESDIKKMYRIGKKGDNPRPMLIEFKEKSRKNMIMENCVRMKQLSDELKNVSISHDFTKEQREKCKKLVAEAKDKQKQESGVFLYRVRGDPSNLRIIKIQKYPIKN
ncbi:hypothetical protein HELRODRAFT_174205 [Helobdella robusta]|uniref:Uncharacterized protein n=1 Tax=Helobdella robusta TaxID=6412 RepID=T1F7S4_HELRO|nr:hypothetical protein HELRODRAFT_174205 [Helobdella robusta]ESO02787.1 hypothetical protein HELRODRAFT_174205 [Helobdella robusta]